VLPMGVAPEAIVDFLFEYKLSSFLFFNLVMQFVESISSFSIDFFTHCLLEVIVHRVHVQQPLSSCP
jgi:hypothetical protein